MLKENFIEELQKGFIKNWDLPALSDYKGDTFRYKDLSEEIEIFHLFYKRLHVKQGDKITLVGKNSKNWAVIWLSIVTYGAVVVPVLAEFHADNVHHIINHSDSILVFSDVSIFETLDIDDMKKVIGFISLQDFTVLFGKKDSLNNTLLKIRRESTHNLNIDRISYARVANDTLASIVYTSGTTGFSKGVMLSLNNLWGNVIFAQNNLPLASGDNILSFLPVAHSYACAFDFLYPISIGCHITFLDKIPSPRILIEAFDEIKPRIIMSVPLILEKIYKKQLKPVISKPIMKILLHTPVIKKVIREKIKTKLTKVFGGIFEELVIGGAALNAEVESFLKMIGFKFTVGYGMTECAPLISYSPWNVHKAGSVGKQIANMEVKIDSEDPMQITGEIMTRGENVMMGYYKNDEATKDVLQKDGWLRTGDLGVIDGDGNIFINGRSKTMILGPSGQNIFPEEIEDKINNLPCVQESIVLQREGKLIALVYPDMEYIDYDKIDDIGLNKLMDNNRKNINANLPSYSKISKIEIQPEEFEKTPKKSIKRFLYTH